MPTAPTCAVLISQNGAARQVVLDLAQDAPPSIGDHLCYHKAAVVYLTGRTVGLTADQVHPVLARVGADVG